MKLRLVLACIVIAVFATFVLTNWDAARINFFWIVTAEMPVSLAILAAGALGFAAGELVSYVRNSAGAKKRSG
ncbi:MAG: hypothetical protein ACKVWV_02945 [Planctomycetota bacterium]